MDLFEYQGKQYFARFDIPVSPGDVAYTVEEAIAAAEAAGYPVVVKAQVQVGGRGKAGGIKLANDADEVRTHAGNILGMDIKGHVVKRVWDFDFPMTAEGMVLATLWRGADDSATRAALGTRYRPIAETLSDALRWMWRAGHLEARHIGRLAEEES